MSETSLFKRAACFTDIHFGKKSNSEDYNRKCEAFIDWFIKESKEAKAETCIFLGDWHDSRISLHVKTLNYSLRCMEKVADAFENFYFITGNHDIYHRTRRDYNSVVYGKNLTNLHIINDPVVLGNVALVPWIVSDEEHKDVKKMKAKYVFGHFEFPNFMMNGNTMMADHGKGVKAEDFTYPDLVFSGHFHSRQNKGNVWYMGNAFPQNFTDMNSDERGMMLLDWGSKDPVFKTWPDQPVFRMFDLSSILDDPEKYIGPNVNARINVDLDISYEEAQLLRESFLESYKAEDIKFIHKHTDLEETEWDGDVQFQTVDQIVLEGLSNLDNDSVYDKNLLKEIYNQLEI